MKQPAPVRVPITVDTAAATADLAPLGRLLLALAEQRARASAQAAKPVQAEGGRA